MKLNVVGLGHPIRWHVSIQDDFTTREEAEKLKDKIEKEHEFCTSKNGNVWMTSEVHTKDMNLIKQLSDDKHKLEKNQLTKQDRQDLEDYRQQQKIINEVFATEEGKLVEEKIREHVKEIETRKQNEQIVQRLEEFLKELREVTVKQIRNLFTPNERYLIAKLQQILGENK